MRELIDAVCFYLILAWLLAIVLRASILAIAALIR